MSLSFRCKEATALFALMCFGGLSVAFSRTNKNTDEPNFVAFLYLLIQLLRLSQNAIKSADFLNTNKIKYMVIKHLDITERGESELFFSVPLRLIRYTDVPLRYFRMNLFFCLSFQIHKERLFLIILSLIKLF